MDEQLNKTHFGDWLGSKIADCYGDYRGRKLFSNRIGYPPITIYRWVRNERIPSGYAFCLIIKTLSEDIAKKDKKDKIESQSEEESTKRNNDYEKKVFESLAIEAVSVIVGKDLEKRIFLAKKYNE